MATATIHARIVDLDELIPRVINAEQEDRDVEKLMPWAFRDGDIAPYNCETFWPAGRNRFRSLFSDLPSYHNRLKQWQADHRHEPDLCETGITRALRQFETITLPRKNWNVAEDQTLSSKFIHDQGRMLQKLLQDAYDWLDLSVPKGLRVYCPSGKPKLKYVIGGEKFASRYQGAVTVGPPGLRWWEGQTWKEFLTETVSVMLGQLAANLKVYDSLCDQRGFCGWLPRDVVSRVQMKGCSESEVFELKFTPGYDLCLRQDWVEAVRVLSRLFRYLLSGNANVGGIQDALGKVAYAAKTVGYDKISLFLQARGHN
ncbi:hypothetical protein AJ80_03576 [Polytolypa hystricis UAMH7299]|uniref:Uncharacterized protein n=1 Tax=Polytolypa hystricis (strain UAMH7299) TaxID=1447883 RepID=A0A2B7YGX5_POLH7|nr:hypothetical protein AJ80_03576 [Polytolypa hystricis UAMH7299]